MIPALEVDTSSDPGRSFSDRRHTTVWILVTLVLLTLVVSVGYDIVDDRAALIKNEQERLLTQAKVIETNLERQTRSVADVLRSVSKDSDADDMNRRLTELTIALPGVRTLLILDKEGRTVASNREEILQRDFSSRDYYAIPRNQPILGRMYVSPPFKTVLNRYVINLSMVIPDKSGGFNGVIGASLDPEYFAVLLKSVQYSDDMWSSIMHGNGLMFMMVPENRVTPGFNLAVPGTFFTRHTQSGKSENLFFGASYLVGTQRMVVMRTFNPPLLHLSNPLVIAVSRDMDAVLENWQTDSVIKGVIALFSGGFLVLGTVFLQHRQRSLDMQARKVFEEQIITRQEIFRAEEWQSTFDAVNDSICLLDEQLRVVRCNNATYAMTGMTEIQITGSYCWDIFFDTTVPHDDYPAVQARINKTRVTREIGTGDRFSEVTVDPIVSVENIPTGFVHVVRDITERVCLANSFQEEKNLYKDLVDTQPAGIYRLRIKPVERCDAESWAEVVESSYEVDLVTSRFCKIIGIDMDVLTSNPAAILELVHPEDRVDFIEKNALALNSRTNFKWEGRFGSRQKVVWIRFESVPRKLDNGEVLWTGVVTDITEFKHAENLIREMQAQMMQNDKLATIGQLAAGVAHEINNPMGFVGSNMATLAKYIEKYHRYIEMIETEICACSSGELPEQIQSLRSTLKLDYVMRDISVLVEESNEGIERVKQIVQDLRVFSRADSSSLGPADLNKCMDSTINIVFNEIKYVAELKREYGALPKVRCNAQQINQVFMNLLINAAHAIQAKSEAVGIITIRSWCDQDSVCVAVSDTGCGIAEEHCSKIFDAFFTTKDVGKGTGLGLSISSSIVRKHGGEIMVNSNVGIGTTFTVSLPIVSKLQNATVCT